MLKLSLPSKAEVARRALVGLGKLYCSLLFLRHKMQGAENIPPGAKIITPNHPNSSDVFHLFGMFPGLLSLAQADLFDLPVIGWIFKNTGQIPVDAQDPQGKRAAFERACEVLRQGRTLMVFPEGVLSPQGNGRIGTGAVRMSLATGAPILPFGLYVRPRDLVRFEMRMKGRGPRIGHWQWRGRLYIQVGRPWFPAQEPLLGGDQPDVQELTRRLMARIHELARMAESLADGVRVPAPSASV